MTSFAPAPVPPELLNGCLPPLPLPRPFRWPGLGDETGPLPLIDTAVTGHLTGLGLRITLRQRYRNDRRTPIEASYVFPLPDRCAVTALTATLAGTQVRGVLSERGAARAAYDEAVESGSRAVLVEQERGDVFTATLGNLPPGEEAVVELSLTGTLGVDDGLATLRFPLVIGERYVPGAPLAQPPVGTGTTHDTDQVPDASRITPPRVPADRAAGIRVDLVVDPAGLGGETPELSTTPGLVAEVLTTTPTPSWRLTNAPGLAADHDLVVRYPVAGAGSSATAVLATDLDDPDSGTWQVVVSGGEDARIAARPRDVVVLLDRSGSMGGWKMVAARRAAARIVDALGADDRFAVLAFDHLVETPLDTTGLRTATDRDRFAAGVWLGSMTARGGTELAAPLHTAADLLTDHSPDRERVLVLVTDGQVGNEAAILHALTDRLAGVRVYALGIDQAVNASFLRNLAALGGGRCDLVDSEDDLDRVLQQLQRRIAPPLVQALAVHADGIALVPGTATPSLTDLFPAGPAVITGRWHRRDDSDQVTITVAGEDRAGRLVEWHPAVHLVPSEADALRTTWARARVADLENAHDAHGGPTEPIVELSLVHGVLSRFTAWLAVGPGGVTGTAVPVTQPVAEPAGWLRPAGGPSAGPLRRGLQRLARGAAAARPRGSVGGSGFAPAPTDVTAPANVTAPAAARMAAPMAFGGTAPATEAATELPPPDLRPFAARITALLERAESGGDDLFAVDLAELLDDLRSVLAPDALVAVLAAVRPGDSASVTAARTAVADLGGGQPLNRS